MKKYRTEWTIEPTSGFISILQSNTAVQWYRGTIDMDNVHYCATELEAEREIDDAIISEQEMQLKIAVQCIEANMREFIYRRDHSNNILATQTYAHHVQLCAKALKAIQE